MLVLNIYPHSSLFSHMQLVTLALFASMTGVIKTLSDFYDSALCSKRAALSYTVQPSAGTAASGRTINQDPQHMTPPSSQLCQDLK